MIVFISGCYNSDGSHVEMFSKAADRIAKAGHTAINPAAIIPRVLERDAAIMICLSLIRDSDAVYFIPGWKVSEGAALERRFVEYIGKPVIMDLTTMGVGVYYD